MSLEKLLQEDYGTTRRANRFYKNQMLDYLNDMMMEFIPRQEMIFVSTADMKGNCDCSIRVGRKGFVHVVDQKTIVYPEYRGNGVYASLGNISENPHIGILMVDFYGSTVGLHINGIASIENEFDCVDDPLAERWVKVCVEEAYIQCSKHIPLLEPKDKKIVWNTDDEKLKGGDYFKVQSMVEQ
ncbi:MAG: pyridoxamine 5'-phosphate oxidase family protein [Opitutaceae bacterium]|nr:pyridoxamine 5'-phosphate oxidase family protein [Opitutaceae bacterium]